MTRGQLFGELAAARPGPDEFVFIERRGDDYRWNRTSPGAPVVAVLRSSGEPLPDAWIYYAGRWPVEEPDRWPAFFDDLLAEMESMAQGGDRCRWPFDEPWPSGHVH